MGRLSRTLAALMACTLVRADTLDASTETFVQGRFDASQWKTTVDGDLRHWAVDVVEASEGTGDLRLRLSADSRGSRDDAIKFLGVRSIPLIRLAGEAHISLDVDWNNQANGSYLSAAVVLSPYATGRNPFEGSEWLKVEYIGVPPGKNGRMVIGLKERGQERTLYNEGWPQNNRTGREIGRQRLEMVLRNQSLQVWENAKLLYDSKGAVVRFGAAYLYLQMSTHSNYARREIYFDNIHVTSPTSIQAGDVNRSPGG